MNAVTKGLAQLCGCCQQGAIRLSVGRNTDLEMLVIELGVLYCTVHGRSLDDALVGALFMRTRWNAVNTCISCLHPEWASLTGLTTIRIQVQKETRGLRRLKYSTERRTLIRRTTSESS